MGMIEFSQKRSYKITLIALVSAAALFLVLGTIFAIVNSDTPPAGIQLDGPNLRQETGNIYSVDLVARSTSVRAIASPWGADINAPIRFVVHNGAGRVAVYPTSVRSGESVNIILLTHMYNGVEIPFISGHAAAEDIVIHAIVGQHIAIINANIVTSESNVQIVHTLEQSAAGAFAPVPSGNLSLSLLHANMAAPGNNGAQTLFRLRTRLMVFGQPVYDSARDAHIFRDPSIFSVQEPGNFTGSGINLFNWSPTPGSAVSHIHFEQWPPFGPNTSHIDYPFAISMQFAGRTFTEMFTLRTVI